MKVIRNLVLTLLLAGAFIALPGHLRANPAAFDTCEDNQSVCDDYCYDSWYYCAAYLCSPNDNNCAAMCDSEFETCSLGCFCADNGYVNCECAEGNSMFCNYNSWCQYY
jgi:hypothetical protein